MPTDARDSRPVPPPRRWHETYDALRQWVDAHRCWPSRSSPNGPLERRLAHWVAFQRRQRGSGRLPVERLQLLEAIPGWKATPEGLWQRSYRELGRWVTDHERFPSRSATDPDEARLARWVDTQRRLRRTGERNGTGTMTPERAQLLETIPGWRWSPRQQTWRESYRELTGWVAVHGRLPSTDADDHGERHLAHWVTFQRELRRRRDDRCAEPMSSERQALLEAVPGWKWLSPRRGRQGAWSASYHELTDWVAARGRLPSTSARDGVERRLARWTAYQRSEKRRWDRDRTGPLTPDRQHRLEAIPGWEWSPLRSWDESFRELTRWVTAHDRLPSISSDDPAEARLGRWCAYQRELRRRWERDGTGPSTRERQALLAGVPGWEW